MMTATNSVKRPGQRRARVLSCLFLLLLLAFPAQGEMGTARFVSEQSIAWPLFFSDRFLTGDAAQYHQGLARSSLGMALSAFRVHGAREEHRGDNIKAYLKELGFSNLVLKQYDEQPTINTIATAMASKTITERGEPLTAVALAISGGGYKDEWQSNLTLGKDIHHKGFDLAAREVVKRLDQYLEDHHIKAPYKIWISGYSRAAAVSNRTASILLDSGRVLPQNLYAYTFATPNVTQQEDAPQYPSIYNIVGAFDPVMMIPFDDWGYTRFGQTYYLPAPETNSDYHLRVRPVKAMYLKMTGTEYRTTASGNRLLHKVLSLVSGDITGSDTYTDHYQSLFLSLWQNRGSPFKMLTQSASAFFRDNTLWQQMKGMADKAWTLYANRAGESLLQESGFYQDDRLKGGKAFSVLIHEHYPKKYLAWLSAYEDLDSMISPNRNYRQLAISTPVNLKVLNAADEVVLDHDFARAAPAAQEGPRLALSQVGNELHLTLPADSGYKVTFWTDDNAPDLVASLTLREGRLGFTGMRAFKSPSFTMPANAIYTLNLPADVATSPIFTIKTDSGILPLTASKDINQLNEGEVNSDIKTIMSKNLVTLMGAAGLLVVQVVAYLMLGARAGYRQTRALARRFRGRDSASAPEAAAPKKRRRSPVIRALALLLMLLSLAMGGIAIFALFGWLQQTTETNQPTIRTFNALVTLPYLLLLVLSAFPAFSAAAHALFRLNRVARPLRASLFFCVFALLYTAGLLVFTWYNPYIALIQSMPWLTGLVYGQGVLLLMMIPVLLAHFRKRRVKTA